MLVKMTIKEIRNRIGMSQSEFAREYHIGIQQLQTWEQGRRNVPECIAYLLYRAVKVDYPELFKSEDWGDYMKRYVSHKEDVFGMSNLNPQKSGLGSIIVWSDHGGISRNVSHRGTPRAKLSIDNMNISISIEATPKILAKSKNVSEQDLHKFDKGIEYVGRNYDIFLRHYMDTTFEFDDEDFFQALRDRGEYK